jgi:membrane-associated PAP2 superfamily phosphatase
MKHLVFALLLVLGAGLLQPSAAQNSVEFAGDQLDPPASTVAPAPPTTSSTTAPCGKPVNPLWLIPDLLCDQKAIWRFPVDVVRGHHLKPVLILTSITAGIVLAVDPPSGRYFQKTHAFDGFNQVFSSKNTTVAMFAVPGALYGVGLVRRDSYLQRTFWMAGEAVIDSELVTSVMKDIDRRWMPREVPLNGNFNATWFREPPHGTNILGGIGSFPSGHGIAAFSTATVFADRYPRYRWLAYGLAGLVSFSRVTLQSHFPSDAFAAGFLGYSISHYVVIRAPRREAEHRLELKAYGLSTPKDAKDTTESTLTTKDTKEK